MTKVSLMLILGCALAVALLVCWLGASPGAGNARGAGEDSVAQRLGSIERVTDVQTMSIAEVVNSIGDIERVEREFAADSVEVPSRLPELIAQVSESRGSRRVVGLVRLSNIQDPRVLEFALSHSPPDVSEPERLALLLALERNACDSAAAVDFIRSIFDAGGEAARVQATYTASLFAHYDDSALELLRDVARSDPSAKVRSAARGASGQAESAD